VKFACARSGIDFFLPNMETTTASNIKNLVPGITQSALAFRGTDDASFPAMEQYPRAADLRRLLLERCASYSEATGIALTGVSVLLVNSPKYLGGLASGKTKLTDVAYDRCMTRLDELFKELEGDRSHDDTEQRSRDESSAIPAADRGNRRGTGLRKRGVHGDVPDAAE
jgi:hypothetical protein